jgi:hypothetical protein
MEAISCTETVNIDQITWHDIPKYSIHNHCREKMSCFIVQLLVDRVHIDKSIPRPQSHFFMTFYPSKCRSPKLMFTLLDNNFYLLLNTRKYPLICDVNSSSIWEWKLGTQITDLNLFTSTDTNTLLEAWKCQLVLPSVQQHQGPWVAVGWKFVTFVF